jgi:hypothetical protein
MEYAKQVAERFKGDPVGLLLYLNAEYFELSIDKQANEYNNIRKIVREWVTHWGTSLED